MYVTDRAQLYVSRTICLPLIEARDAATRLRAGHDPVRAVPLPTGGRIIVQLPLRRDDWHPIGRPDLTPLRTYGALYTRGNRRVCNVEVELSAWASGVTELSLRPAHRAPQHWRAPRVRRWFRHAHAAADQLRRDLATGADELAAAERELERLAG